MSESIDRTTDTAGPLAPGGRTDSATEAFVAHRNLLFTVAYEMLGSAADAEMSCRKPGCGGRTSTSAPCVTSARTWSGSPPARR